MTGPRRDPRRTHGVAVVLALALLASIALALRPGPAALFPTLAALWRDVRAHDVDALRLAHDGIYARLAPVYAAIEAQVPADEPLVVRTRGVPPWFVAARFPQRAIYVNDAELLEGWRARKRRYWVLELQDADPLVWSLQPSRPAR
jgi:hypothetical protein